MEELILPLSTRRPEVETHATLTSEIAEKIAPLASTHGRIAIAIAGPPGSGKSSMAATLCAYLGQASCAIPMDGFHLDNHILEERGLLQVKGAAKTFDRQGFATLAAALIEGRARHFPTFDRGQDKVIEAGGEVPETASILVFEGNYLLFDAPGWADLASLWDASIWLEVPEEVLERRLIQRWRDNGLSKEQAIARANENDLVNAREICRNALPATWVLNQEE